MSTLAEFMIVAGADNRPPMLDKPKYEPWKSRMELYIQGKDHGRIILNSVENDRLIWPTVAQENGTVRLKTYEELSDKEKLQADCDLKATKIVLQGLPPDVYDLVNHHKIAKDIWDRVKLLMHGTSLSKKERECKLHDEFDKFSYAKGLAVPIFLLGDDPISCMNKAMAFFSAVFTPRYPSTNNQLRSSSNMRNQANYQDGEGHMARQCTQPKQKRDAAWFKEKVLLTITHNAAFQTDDLNAYNSVCDDISSAKAVLMANLSSCDLDVLSEERITKTKRSKNDQKPTRNESDKSNSEESAKDHSQISPTQQERQSKTPIEVKGLKVTSSQSLKAYFESNPYGAPHHPQQYPTTYPTNLSHTQPFVPQNAYPPPTIQQQPQAEFPQLDSGLEVLEFLPGDDPIAYMNKAMTFLSAVFTPHYPSTNNQLRSSSNPRNQATVQDGRVIVQQVQGRQALNVVGSGSQHSGEGHMARQCTQPKRRRDATRFKENVLLVQAQAEGKELDEEQLSFLADLGVADGQVAQTITHNAAFQTDDLDAYDFDYILSEVPYSDTFQNDMMNQSVQELQYSEQTPIVDYLDNEITSDSNIIPYSQYLEETHQAIVQNTNTSAQQNSMILSMFEQMSNHATNWDKANYESKIVNESLTAELERYKERVKILERRFNVDLSSHEKFIDSQIDDMIRMKNAKFAAFETEIDTLKQTLYKHIKEKESLLTSLNGFKTEFKERESKSIDKVIVLENQNKELENIVRYGVSVPALTKGHEGNKIQYTCMTRSSTKELFTPLKDPKREFRSSRKHFKTLSLDESRSPDFDLFSDQEEYSEEEVAETMAETMEQYMSKTRADDGSGVARLKIEDKDNFELKCQFIKELCTNTFSGSDHEDANKHIEKVLEIVDLFHIPNIPIKQVMIRAFPMSLTGAASRWLRNKPSGSITTWEDMKTKFLRKYCPPARTAKKMEEINKFQQEPDENLYQAWERFKELLMKCHQHYLTEMQEVVLFYNGLDVPTRQILDSRGAIPSKTDADAKVAIKEMAEYSQKWHNGTYRTRSTKTSDGLAAIQA
ncbi:retrovirus-related pol polyprotein from transposon TNT 1-94 [Tanacetum coccineum]